MRGIDQWYLVKNKSEPIKVEIEELCKEMSYAFLCNKMKPALLFYEKQSLNYDETESDKDEPSGIQLNPLGIKVKT
jgi:hypothetical protein